MGNIYSTENTTLQTAGIMVPSRDLGGKARLYPFTFLFTSAAGSAPVLYMSKIHAGMKVWGLFLQTDGLSTSAGIGLTIKIGDSGDDDRFIAAFDADVASTAFVQLRMGSGLGFGYAYTADTWILGTVAASKTPTAAKTLAGFFICSGNE